MDLAGLAHDVGNMPDLLGVIARGLLECQRVIAGWQEALANGQDVQQT